MEKKMILTLFVFLFCFNLSFAFTEPNITLVDYGRLSGMSVCGSTPIGYYTLSSNPIGGITYLDTYGQPYFCRPGLNNSAGYQVINLCYNLSFNLGGSCFNARPVIKYSSSSENYIFWAWNQNGLNAGGLASYDYNISYFRDDSFAGYNPIINADLYLFFFNGTNLTRCFKNWTNCLSLGNYTGRVSSSLYELKNKNIFFQNSTDVIFLDSNGYFINNISSNISFNVLEVIELEFNDNFLFLTDGSRRILRFNLLNGSNELMIINSEGLTHDFEQNHRYLNNTIIHTSRVWTGGVSYLKIAWSFCRGDILVCQNFSFFNTSTTLWGLKSAITSEGLNLIGVEGSNTPHYIKQISLYEGWIVDNGSCFDGIQNQDEVYIDYGGVCGRCINGTNPMDDSSWLIFRSVHPFEVFDVSYCDESDGIVGFLIFILLFVIVIFIMTMLILITFFIVWILSLLGFIRRFLKKQDNDENKGKNI